MKLQIASSFGPRSGTDVDGPDAIVSSIAFVSIASPAALESGVRLTADDNSPTVTFARGNVTDCDSAVSGLPFAIVWKRTA